MDIVIITNFTSSFSDSDNDRFLYIAKMLSYDHNVEIITSDFCHEKKQHRNKTEKEWPFKVTFLHEPGYKKNICVKRFYSHFVWGKNVFKYLSDRKKPDVIYCAVPSLTGPLKASKHCAKNNIRFIIDVQDLWPEAFNMVFHTPFISNMLFFPFKIMANGIYKRADSIVAVSQTYADRALSVNKKCKKVLSVFLGTDLDKFDNYAKKEPILVKSDDEIWLGYCGTLGASYDIKCVIDAVAKLNNNRVRFVVLGDGPMKNEFEIYAKEKQIKVSFLGRLSYDLMCSLLNECDVFANPIIGSSVASIINKHADYAAGGKAIISTQNSKEYQDLINKYQMGFSINPGDSNEFSEKLKILVYDIKLRKIMGLNARKLAEEKFNRKLTYLEIINLIAE